MHVDRTTTHNRAEEMDKLYIGQGHDLFWTFNTKLPTTEEYISMVDYSTCGDFSLNALETNAFYRDGGTIQYACSTDGC